MVVSRSMNCKFTYKATVHILEELSSCEILDSHYLRSGDWGENGYDEVLQEMSYWSYPDGLIETVHHEVSSPGVYQVYWVGQIGYYRDEWGETDLDIETLYLDIVKNI